MERKYTGLRDNEHQKAVIKKPEVIFTLSASDSQTFISAPDKMIWLHHC
jgi:hypothetical protein